MPVGHENISVRRHIHCGRRVEFVWPIAGDAGLAERHEHFAVGAELEHLLALAGSAHAVGHPDIADAVDMQAVWQNEHAGAKAFHQLAGRIEL